MLESGILGIHLHLRQDGGDGSLHLPVQQLFPDGILQVIADIALAHGGADGHGGYGVRGVLPGEGGHGDIDHAHLGAVAVDDHHLVALLDQVHNGFGRVLHSGHLLRQVFAQGIAAQGDDDTFTHDDTSFNLIGYDIKRRWSGQGVFRPDHCVFRDG